MLAVLDLSLIDFTLIFFLVALAGVVDSIAGGGGLITVPTYLAFGMPPGLVLGTNKAVSTVGTSLAVWRYARSGSIDWRLARWALVLSFGGSMVGAWLSRYQSRDTMTVLLLVIVPLVLILSLRKQEPNPDTALHANAPFWAAGMGLIMGAYDGFFGPGTGSFLIFGLVSFLHLSSRPASATARVINLASNAGALLFFATQLQIHLPVAAVAAVGSLTGNYLGSHFVIHRAESVVRPVFFVVLGALLVKLVAEMFL